MKKCTRIGSLILAISIFCSLISTASATTRASEYFTRHEVAAFAMANGDVEIEVTITATGVMDELGAKVINLYEQQSNGTNKLVETYTRDDSDLIETDTGFSFCTVTYSDATAGMKYYAVVGLFAKNSNGSETIYSASNVVTAK